MTATLFGTVLSMSDPEDGNPPGVCRVLFKGLDGPAPAFFDGRRYSPRCPWPGATVRVEQMDPTTYRVLYPLGHRRVLFHDDFTRVDSASGYGDTRWGLGDSSGGTISQVGSEAGGVGVARITTATPTASDQRYDLSKSEDALALPAAPAGLLLTARVTAPSFTGNEIVVGFAASAIPANATNYHVLAMDQPSGPENWRIAAHTPSGGTATEISGVRLADGVWNVLELLVVAGSCTVGWIDGDGPVVIDSGPAAPDPAVALTVVLRSYARQPYTEVAQSCDIDFVTVSLVQINAAGLAA